MNTLFEEWEQDKKEKSKENLAFIKSLKTRKVADLNETVDALHDEVFSKINCLDCGNCCKSFNINMTEEDVARISKYLGKDLYSFLDYTITPEDEILIQTVPCPFLGKDNACSIYEVRPEVCQVFPHIKGKDIAQQRYQQSMNTEVCPATYHILERLKQVI